MTDIKNDEFEFKPLTKGLGFHPKKEAAASQPTAAKPISFTPKPLAQAPAPKMTAQASTTSRNLNLNSPLPRPETKKTPPPSQSTQAVDSILKNLNDKNQRMSFDDKAKNLSPFLQTAPSLSAGFLDMLLITSLGLLYLMTLIFTLKIDLVKSITEGDINVWLATAAVFVGVGFIYYVTQRMFMGFTLGEWAYEQRLGLPEEMKKPTYSLKVVARQLLLLATGVVFIPLISWALGRDLGGVSGLCIYRKR